MFNQKGLTGIVLNQTFPSLYSYKKALLSTNGLKILNDNQLIMKRHVFLSKYVFNGFLVLKKLSLKEKWNQWGGTKLSCSRTNFSGSHYLFPPPGRGFYGTFLIIYFQIDPVEIPASDEVKWEFCSLNAGKVSCLLDPSTAVKSHLGTQFYNRPCFGSFWLRS